MQYTTIIKLDSFEIKKMLQSLGVQKLELFSLIATHYSNSE